jgi:hypothetical protein
MRIQLKLASFVVMLTLCTTCGRTTTPNGATAEVTRDKATFTVPVEQRSIWRWNLESTPFNAFEYDWSISQGDRSFGLSVWKNGDAPPKQGSLPQLVEAGQGAIWEPTSSGGGRLVGEIDVTTVRQGSALEMVLSDQSVLKELLEKRPPTLEVVSRTLDTAKSDKGGTQSYSINEQRYSIAVNYKDR